MTLKYFSTKVWLLAGLMCVGFSGRAFGQDAATVPSAVDVATIKAQEFSRALAQLKIQEITLARATPPDAQALDLNRAQQAALDQELAKIAAVPAMARSQHLEAEVKRLEAEKEALSENYRPKHPKMIMLQQEIEQAKTMLAASR